jgi:hypothetical protein
MIGSTRDISPPRFSHESAVSRMLDRYIPFYAILIGHYNHVLNVYTNRIPRVQHATLVLILLAASQKPLRIASLQRALNTLGYFLYYTRKNKNHPQASGFKRTRKVCYVQKVLACASIRVELTIHHPPPSRRSFPACATNASTISERGITCINLSAWIHYSGNESATSDRFVGVVHPECHFSAVSATDPRTTVTRSIKSKAT